MTSFRPLEARQLYPRHYRFRTGLWKGLLLWEIPDKYFPKAADPLGGYKQVVVARPPKAEMQTKASPDQCYLCGVVTSNDTFGTFLLAKESPTGEDENVCTFCYTPVEKVNLFNLLVAMGHISATCGTTLVS